MTCSHCQLPVGRLGQRREVQGDAHWFCCYGCALAFQVHHGARDEPEAAAALIRLGVGGFLAMNTMLFSLLLYADAFRGDEAWLKLPVLWLLWALATALLVSLGGPFFVSAWRALSEGRPSADVLVCIGAAAAYGYSAVQVLRGSEQVYFDTAAMVLLLFTLGRYLEAQGRAHAARCLAPMLAAERAEVRVLRGGIEQVCVATEVLPGDIVFVRPGERVAVDGVVTEGRSSCDESVLTGQSNPVAKAPGNPVVAGSVNGTGLLCVRATLAGAQTRWVRIGRLVREALAARSPTGDTVDRVAAAFIPAVLLLALATGLAWAARGEAEQAWMAGLAVLVVACPCSLGLAASLAGALAIGQAAQRGMLVRGAAVFEALGHLRGIAFDKTGTLTQARFEAVAIHLDAPSGGTDEALLLHRAAALARASDHPLSRALASLGGPGDMARQVQACAGFGLRGEVDGTPCAIGSAPWMATLGWPVAPALAGEPGAGCSVVFIGWQGEVHGRVDFVAPLSIDAAAAVAAMHQRGLTTLLLSGDGAAATHTLARRLGIGTVHAGLAPEGKLELIRDWQTRCGPLAMVGDGLNDGPALAAASVGIAVGDGASDLARESADVVLPTGGLASLPWLLALADRMRRSVRANLIWAFSYNAVALGLAATGLLQPVIAAALMAGSSLIVAWRSWRAGRLGAWPEQGRADVRNARWMTP